MGILRQCLGGCVGAIPSWNKGVRLGSVILEMSDQIAADQMVDTKGLTCPIPVLEAKKALRGMAAGAVLKILATDPAAKEDFETFCRSTGHELLDFSDDGKVQTFFIKRSA